MKKIHCIYAVLFSIACYSCQTYTVVPIDFLVPANVSFPAQIKKVGIVNNTCEEPGKTTGNSKLDSALLRSTNEITEKYMLNGDAKIAAESLAEYIAAEKYFDEVVICDSALQTSGTPKQTPYLSKETITGLTQSLEVDMLICLEELQILVKRQVFPTGDMGFLGSVDAKVFPKISLYIANRNSPLITINGNDSIFWESIEASSTAARTKVIPDDKLIAEASDFSGSIPVKYMIPHWKTTGRFFYNNGSPEMRDAAFFVQENNWDKASELWLKYAVTARGIKKARVASNISLYYEIRDDLEKAHEWGRQASDLAKAANKADDYTRIRYNQDILEERRSNFSTLKMQMDRFYDDFQPDSPD